MNIPKYEITYYLEELKIPFCRNCGSTVEDHDAFCENCGMPLQEQQAPILTPPASGLSEPLSQGRKKDTSPQYSPPSPRDLGDSARKKKNIKWFIAVGIIILVLIFLLIRMIYAIPVAPPSPVHTVDTIWLTDGETGDKIQVSVSPSMLKEDGEFLSSLTQSIYMTRKNINQFDENIFDYDYVSGNSSEIDWLSVKKFSDALFRQSSEDAQYLEAMTPSSDFIPLKENYISFLNALEEFSSLLLQSANFYERGDEKNGKESLVSAYQIIEERGYASLIGTYEELKALEQQYNFNPEMNYR